MNLLSVQITMMLKLMESFQINKIPLEKPSRGMILKLGIFREEMTLEALFELILVSIRSKISGS